MSEEGKKITKAIRTEAEKLDEAVRKLASSARETPLQLSCRLHECKSKDLYLYMKTTYTKPEEWAIDCGIQRSTFFMLVQARELNKTMPEEKYLKFKSVANALWFGKLPEKSKTDVMFEKACTENAEDFEEMVKKEQKDNGQEPSDSRVNVKYRMYAGQKQAWEGALEAFINHHKLVDDDYGRAMELMSTVIMQDIGKGGNIVVKLQDRVRAAAFEMGQSLHLFGAENKLSADETLKALQATFEKVTALLMEASGSKLDLPPAEKSKTQTEAPQTPAEAKAVAETFLKGGKKAVSAPTNGQDAAGGAEGPSKGQAPQAAPPAPQGGGKSAKVSLTSKQLASLRVQ